MCDDVVSTARLNSSLVSGAGRVLLSLPSLSLPIGRAERAVPFLDAKIVHVLHRISFLSFHESSHTKRIRKEFSSTEPKIHSIVQLILVPLYIMYDIRMGTYRYILGITIVSRDRARHLSTTLELML